MMLLQGKPIAQAILEDLDKQVKELRRRRIVPALAVVLVGRDPASIQYVHVKRAAAESVGIDVVVHKLAANTPEKKVLELIAKLNKDFKVKGILVQLPLPAQISREKIAWAIDPAKDVDGFQMRVFEPPAPQAIIEILRHYDIPIARKRMVIIGEGFLVGKPLSVLARKFGAMVTTLDSKITNLAPYLRDAQIVVAATGTPKLIKAAMVTPNQVIIDAATGTLNGEVVGDVDLKNVGKVVKAISPVPGGVGPVTVAVLLRNVVKASKLK
ncbi:bifunctional methylenetetrahydrofolate dehydrogenase/methenyltetrahydrofolate cyclohydrolase [Candidatus Berkelbacteria bacterium]|nr:bifunctional methylenetetrahydrofolate dehydrogenase/methenyltetrahydrofolate cyclohydrolase [Candidatus Berkelbacteria bacterium]